MAGKGLPLRVLHLSTDLAKGGAQRFVIDLARAFEQRGDVELVIGSLYGLNDFKSATQGLRIEPLHFQTFSIRAPNSCPAYPELLRRFAPHVVHTHRFLAEFLTSYALSPDIAYVCHGHDNMVQLRPWSWRTVTRREALTNYLERQHLIREKYRRVPTVFVANSSDTFEYYRRVLPREMRRDVVLIPPGFDYDRFAIAEAPQTVDAGRLRILNVGSFYPKKNQIFIIEIARELVRRGVDFQIDLLGEGPTRAAVQAAVNAAQLGGRVVLHGNVDDVEAWLHKSHIYLHVATYEPFGLVFLEAMASGVPPITLDGLGNRDIIRDGQNGFMLQRLSAPDFADRIIALSSDPQRYLEMSTRARNFARGYDIGLVADRMAELYRERVDLIRGNSNRQTGRI